MPSSSSRRGSDAFTPPSIQIDFGLVTEARGKSRLKSKSSRDRSRNIDSIWSVPEPEKPTKAKSGKPKKSKSSGKGQEGKNFLENPVYENQLQNWTLPRVELWCRDTDCPYNLTSKGTQHQQHRHHHQPTLPQHPYQYHHSHDTSASTTLARDHSHLPNEISIKSVPMAINPHKSPSHGNMHMNMSMNMNVNNLNTKDISLTKADFSPTATTASTDTMASTTSSINNTITVINDTNNTIAKTSINNTDSSGSGSSSTRSATGSAELGSASTNTTGFDSGSGSHSKSDSSCKSLTRSERLSIIYPPSTNYPSLPYMQAPPNPFCPSCNGVVPLNHLEPIQEVTSLKGENGFWNFNNFHHPLQRDTSFHSFGGFTLNGQYNAQVKKHKVVKFCSSHKIALVVSSFSLLVTIGLVITLLLMKKKGMMET